MNIFSIFKRGGTDPNDMTPAEILRLRQENVPEYYKASQHFQDSKEFLEHNEWALALESLIDMADESEDRFVNTFWLDLATCADKMQMTERANYCREQVLINEKDV